MNEVVTISTDNYATMAKAMGVPTMSSDKKTNVLNRFRLWHQPTMGKDINSQGKGTVVRISNIKANAKDGDFINPNYIVNDFILILE